MSSKKSFRKHTALIIAAFIVFGPLSFVAFNSENTAAAPFGGPQANDGANNGALNNTTQALRSSFQVLNITFSNEKPQKGELVNITIVLRNNGTINISGMAISFYVDPIVWVELPPLWSNVVSIAANETVELKLNWTAEPGSHAFLLKVKYADVTLVSRRDTVFVRGDELGNPAYPFLAIVAVTAALVCALTAPSLRDNLSNRSGKVKDNEKSANKKT